MKNIVIISIVVIVIAVALYAMFARKTTVISTGGETQTHSGALSWLDGILNGLHLSVAP